MVVVASTDLEELVMYYQRLLPWLLESYGFGRWAFPNDGPCLPRWADGRFRSRLLRVTACDLRSATCDTRHAWYPNSSTAGRGRAWCGQHQRGMVSVAAIGVGGFQR